MSDPKTKQVAHEALACYCDMVNECLGPGLLSRPALDDLWHAMQTKHGSAQRQFEIALQRAMLNLDERE